MSTTYIQGGSTIDIVAGSNISAGDVVAVGDQIGVAVSDIATGATGAVSMEGVFKLPKVTAAVIAQGEEVIWDTSVGKFDDSAATPATGDISKCCVAWEAAGNGVTTVKVKLNVGVGVVA